MFGVSSAALFCCRTNDTLNLIAYDKQKVFFAPEEENVCVARAAFCTFLHCSSHVQNHCRDSLHIEVMDIVRAVHEHCKH